MAALCLGIMFATVILCAWWVRENVKESQQVTPPPVDETPGRAEGVATAEPPSATGGPHTRHR